jgi:hypothetical protein
MSSATPVVVKLNDDFPITLSLIADIVAEVNTISDRSVEWYVDDVFYSSNENEEYVCLERKVYTIRCVVEVYETYQWVQLADTTFTIDSTFAVNLQFRIYNNYGRAPLTFDVEDITDYSNTLFKPYRWTWRIRYFGCIIGKTGVNKRRLTVAEPGQYGLTMYVSDGITTYSVTRDNCIIALSSDVEVSQIELAHEEYAEKQRHVIKTNHSYTDADKNTISFLLWGSEVATDDLAENEILRLANEKIISKNIYPFETTTYDVGEDENRWEEIISIYLDMKINSQSKILKLWSGK